MARIRGGEIFYDVGIDTATLNAAMRALAALATVAGTVNRSFAGGNPTLNAYRAALKNVSDAMKESKSEFERGLIGPDEYARRLALARAEAERLQDEIQNLGAPELTTWQDFDNQLTLSANAAKMAADNMKDLLNLEYKQFDDAMAGINKRMENYTELNKSGRMTTDDYQTAMTGLANEIRVVQTDLLANAAALQRTGAAGDEAVEAQNRFAKTQAAVSAALNRATAVAGDNRVEVGGVIIAYDRLNLATIEQGKAIGNLLDRIKALSSAMKNNEGNMESNIAEMKALQAQLNSAREAYLTQTQALRLNLADQKKVSSALSVAGRAHDTAAAAIRRHTGALQSQNLANILTQGTMTLLTDKIFQASPTLGIFTNSLIYSTQGLRAFIVAAAPVVAVAGSMIAVFATLTASLRSAVGLEGALANVRKTTGLTEGDLKAMTKQFQAVSKEIPISTLELIEMARVAGQLGINGVDNLQRFSVAVSKLAIATDIVGEEGATALARFLQAAGTESNKLGIEAERLGNVLNALENSTAATAREILDMTSYTAGLGSQVGATTDQILAINASLLALGVQQEAGGSAIVRILAKMQSAASEGGEELRTLAEYTGMTSGEFELLVLKSPTEALAALATGLNKASSEGSALSDILTELGINEVRERRTLSALTQGVDVYTAALATARREMFLMSSLEDEIAIQREKTESKIKMLTARFSELGQNIGTSLLPLFHRFLDILITVSDNLDVVGIAVASFGVALGHRGLFSVLSLAVGGLRTFAITLGSLVAANAPLMIAAALITGVSIALAKLRRESDLTKVSLEKVNTALGESANLAESVTSAEDLGNLVIGLGARMRIDTNIPEDIRESTTSTFEAAAREVVNALEQVQEPTAVQIAEATGKVIEYWMGAMAGPVALSSTTANNAASAAIQSFRNSLVEFINQAAGFVMPSNAPGAMAGNLFNNPDVIIAELDAIINSVATLDEKMALVKNIILDASTGQQSSQVSDALLFFIQNQVGLLTSPQLATAIGAINTSYSDLVEARAATDRYKTQAEEVIADLTAAIIANLTPGLPTGVGQAEFDALVDSSKESIGAITNALETIISNRDTAITALEAAENKFESYRQTMIDLNALLSMPLLDADVRRQILDEQERIRGIMGSLTVDIRDLKAGSSSADKAKDELSRVNDAMKAYNDAINALFAAQELAIESRDFDNIKTEAEMAAEQVAILADLLKVFYEVSPEFRLNPNNDPNFANFKTFFDNHLGLYKQMVAQLPAFAQQAVDRMVQANEEIEAEFNRLIEPTQEDRLRVVQEQANNLYELIAELDSEILRLNARGPVAGLELEHDITLDQLEAFRQSQWEAYKSMVASVEGLTDAMRINYKEIYATEAVMAANEAGAEDLAEAITAVANAGFLLNKDVLAALRENFPEVSARVQATEGALRAFYEALADIDLREDLGLVDEYDALSERLRAAETRLLEVSKSADKNSLAFELAAAQVEKYRRAVDAVTYRKTFDDFNESIKTTERNLRIGLIDAETALQQKIQDRQTLIDDLSNRENVNARELQVQLRLLRQDQEALNESIARRGFTDAAQAYKNTLVEIGSAVQSGLLNPVDELSARIDAQTALIDAAVARYGRYSSIVAVFRGELKALTDEYNRLTGPVQAYNDAVAASAEAIDSSKRLREAGVEDEIEAQERILSAYKEEFDAAKNNIELSEDQLQLAAAKVITQQRLVDRLTEERDLAKSITEAEEQLAQVIADNEILMRNNLMTRAEAADAQAEAVSALADAMEADDGLTDGVIALRLQVAALRLEAEEFRKADDLTKATKAFNDALAAIAKDLAENDITPEDAVRKQIDLMLERANALEQAAGEVTDEVKELRAAAELLAQSLEEPASGLERLASVLAAVGNSAGSLIANFAKVGSTVAGEIEKIVDGIEKINKAQDKTAKSKAWGTVTEAIATAVNAIGSLVPRVDSFAANMLDGVVALGAAITEMVTESIPGIGAVIAAAGSLLISLLGDMSNGIKQVRQEIEGLAASSQYLSSETIAAFTKIEVKIGDEFVKVTQKVSRGGLLGLLGFKKDQLNKEAMDIVMGIANGLANGFAGAMTQAIQTGVAGGDWRQAFRDAFKTTVLNAIVNTFVTATLLAEDFAKFIEALTIAIATGNLEEVNRLINEELPKIIANGEEQVDGFVKSVPDALKTYSDNITSGVKGAYAAALKGAFSGDKDWRVKFRNAFKETILNALVDALVAGAVMATKFQEFVARLTKAIADGNIDEAKRMMREELPAIIQEGEDTVADLEEGIPEELRPEEFGVDQTLSSGLNSAFSTAVDGAFKGEPDWGKKLRENVKQALIDSISKAIVDAMMASEEITKFMEEFTRILKEEGPEAAAKYAKDNFDRVVDAGTAGAARAGEILADTFGKSAEEITDDFVDATMQANDFMTESLARTIAFLSTINGVIDEATSDMMISIAEKISSGFEGGFRDGINAMLAGEEDWRDKLGDSVRDTILQSLIDSFIASAAISTIAADFTEGFLRAMQDPNVDAAQWAKDNIGTAIDGMATLIETFVSSIPDELLPSSNPRSPRYQRPDRNEDRGGGATDRTPRQAGTNISEITGPTRDLLVDLLRPLSILPSWTSMIRDIRNDVRAIATGGIVTPVSLPGPTAQPAFAGAGIVNNISIQNLSVTTQATNAREFYNDLSKIAYRDRRGGK